MTVAPEEVVSTLRRLVAIPSVTGEERPLAEALGSQLERAGLAIEFQEVEQSRPNVIARLEGGGQPSLLLAGHLDVVSPGEGWRTDPFTPHVEGDRLYGRGTCDMKAGLAAMVTAVESIVRDGLRPPGDVIFAGVVGEEEDLAGSTALVAAGFRADMAIVGEPTELAVVRAHKGAVTCSLELKGRAAHASTPSAGINAIEAMTDVIRALREQQRAILDRAHPVLGPGTLTVGTIRGGTRPYVVPDSCVIEIDRRILPGEDAGSVRAEVEQALDRLPAPWRNLPVEITIMVEALPFETPESHPLVARMVRASREAGLPGHVGTWPAVSDASVLANGGGMPTVLFGPGSISEAAHQPNEFVRLPDVVAAAKVYRYTVLAGAGDAPK